MRVLLVPGFAQTVQVWDPTIASLGNEIEVRALDIPQDADFTSTALALGASGGRGIYAGYSMGGRLVLYLALERPELVTQLIMISSGPGLADPAQRRARQAADRELADWIEKHTRAEFLDRWSRQPLLETVTEEVNRRNRLASTAEIADQLRRLGQGSQPSLWARLTELRMPVTFVVGEEDGQYGEIASQAASMIGPNAVVISVSRAGHALIHDFSDAVARTIRVAATRGK